MKISETKSTRVADFLNESLVERRVTEYVDANQIKEEEPK